MAKSRRKSVLATYESLSPNATKPRTKKIRRLIPHCMAGNLTIEACLNLARFKNADDVNGASCNYAIDSKGRVGLGVDEINRAWCTSNRNADMEGISFEIANDGGADTGWHMSDAAINAWLDLATDIAKFYGYAKVAYYGNKDNLGSSDEMVIQFHRWYAAKACPGDYFVGITPRLVIEINARLAGKAATRFVGPTSKASSVAVTQPATAVQTTAKAPTQQTSASSKFKEYKVSVSAPSLNVRGGPGTNHNVVSVLRNDKNIYTIVDEEIGPGSKTVWCKLKSGAGWLSKDFLDVVK